LAFCSARLTPPGSDGAPVLLKYAIGAAPGAIVNAPITPVATPSRGISFIRLSPAPVDYAVQSSTELSSWTTSATLPTTSDTWTGPASVSETGTSDTRAVTVTAPLPLSANPRRFLRLRIAL
jgi:hypothetical protein